MSTVYRAYSVLEVKSVDADRRIIRGVATSPSPDRMGDIVEPLGVTFKNPLPLLLYHDSRLPVGEATFRKPTAKGVEFEATFPEITEPASLKERVDTAWASVKSGLLKGVSIGFRSLEEAFNKETNGFRFIKSEVLELSLVAIPANADATIHTIKSCDLASLATHGTDRAAAPSLPAAVGVSSKAQTMTISEKILAAQTAMRTKAERLTVLMDMDGADGSLDDAQVVERKALTDEITTMAQRIDALKALEASEQSNAKPVTKSAPDHDVREPQAPQRITVKQPELPPGIEFTRAFIARGAALLTGASAIDIAKSRFADTPRVALALKEAVAGASTYDSTSAGPLVYATNLASEFIDYLRPMTILGKMTGATRIPFNVRIGGQTSGGSASWVGEGRAKPVTSFAFNDVTLLWAKVAAITVQSAELFRFSNPSSETLLRDALVGAVRERLDIDFIDPSKAASSHVSPASITNGLTPLVSHGNDVDAVDADVQAMFTAFINANITPTSGVWIMPNTVALALSLMRTGLGNRAFPDINMNGGTFYGLPVITSQYAVFGTPTRNLVALVNQSDIFLADDGGFSVDVSREATIEMDDSPTQSLGPLGSPIGAVGGSSAFVNMFQTNGLAIRVERYINWARRRDAGVVFTDDVNWAPGGASV